MAGMFDDNGNTSAKNILTAFRFFREHPEGRIMTGVWTDGPDGWDRARFMAWFRKCLNRKINRNDTRQSLPGRKLDGTPRPARPWRSLSDDYQRDLWHDAQTIRQYTTLRYRHTGCRGLLRTREMKKRFPHIDNQPSED